MRICGKPQTGSIESKPQAKEGELRSINGVANALDISVLEGQRAKSKHRADQAYGSSFFCGTVANTERLFVECFFAVKLVEAVECVSMKHGNDRMDVVEV